MKLRRLVLGLSLFIASGVAQARAADAPGQEAISPKTGVIKLFNGKDLSGLYTWLKDAKYEDPRKVFTVEDGLLHISGDGWGYVCTKQRYKDYHLVSEFKWGPRTWLTRKDRTKDSGIMLHCLEPDGSYVGVFMASIEAQIIQGGTGDILAVPGKRADGTLIPISLTCEVTKDRNGQSVWQKGGQRKTFTSGRINWFGRDPAWKDVLGFRGKQDIEKPDGQWNRMDVICDGGHFVISLNGVMVNEGFDASPSSGKILYQCEAAEIFVRRWELWPLGKAPKFDGR
jgi:hypothetical protein